MTKSLLLLSTIFTLFSHGQKNWQTTPLPTSPPVNQLRANGNACGPACLIDAFRSGSNEWQKSIQQIKGANDTAKIISLIHSHGKKGSALNPKRYRWNGRYGINITDLTTIANELRAHRKMPTVKSTLFFQSERQNARALLKHTHRQLSRSLKKGLPPIIRVRRMTFKSTKGSAKKVWLPVKRHYLVITGLPKKLPRNATSFQVTYHDPWGGKKYSGSIQIPDLNTSSIATPIAYFPQSNIGKKLIPKKQLTTLSLSSAIGLF